MDIRGIFVSPPEEFYAFDHQDQINNERNDVVFYELNKYLLLLSKNNPTAVELLFAPSDTVEFRHQLFPELDRTRVISKLCQQSFTGYAESQIKRSRGLNKKVFNPRTGEVPRPIDFCYVVEGGKTLPLEAWLSAHGMSPDHCGLVALNHVRDGYALYYDAEADYRGLFRPEGMELCLSSVPKGREPAAWIVFNKDELKLRFREYHQYQEWEENRNQSRYEGTLAHGGGYDAKNMMHTFRLLRMAGEIAETGVPQIRRTDRENLLAIRSGRFTYQELMEQVDAELQRVNRLYQESDLRETPDLEYLEEYAIQIRTALYGPQ